MSSNKITRGSGLPSLAKTPRREKSGRSQRPASRQERESEAMVETLKTRCRHNGMDETPENLNLVKAQHFEGQVGQLLNLLAAVDEVSDYWRTFAAWDSVEQRYSMRILGKPRYAKTAKLEMMPEPLETRDDDASEADTRTPDEKDRAAVNAWMSWRGDLGKLSAEDQSILHDGALGRCDLVIDGVATMAGRSFFRALRRLQEIKE